MAITARLRRVSSHHVHCQLVGGPGNAACGGGAIQGAYAVMRVRTFVSMYMGMCAFASIRLVCLCIYVFMCVHVCGMFLVAYTGYRICQHVCGDVCF